MTLVEEFQRDNWNSLRCDFHQSKKIANAYYKSLLELEPQIEAFAMAEIELSNNQVDKLIKTSISQKIGRDVTASEFKVAASLIKGLTE